MLTPLTPPPQNSTLFVTHLSASVPDPAPPAISRRPAAFPFPSSSLRRASDEESLEAGMLLEGPKVGSEAAAFGPLDWHLLARSLARWLQ